MKNLLRHLCSLILLFSYGIFFIHKLFLKGFIFYGEEQAFLNYDFVNYKYTYIWDWATNFGHMSSSYFNIFTTGLIWKIGAWMKLSLYDTSQFFFLIIILSTLLFSYLCFYAISKSTRLAILLSILYVTTYDYFASINTSPRVIHFLFLPATTFLLFQYLKKYDFRYLIINTIILLLTLGISINPPQLIGAYFFIVFATILFSHYQRRKLYLADWVKISFFYFPYILNILFVFSVNFLVLIYQNSITTANPFFLSWNALNSRISEDIRLFGAWWDYAGNKGQSYNHLVSFYHSFIGIIISYIPFLALFSILALKKIDVKIRIRILVCALLILFLVKGGQAPFGQIADILFSINVFKIFREPWAKFIIDFIFFLFLAFAIINSAVGKKIQTIILLLLTTVFLFQIIPVFQGIILDHKNIDWKKSDVRVPIYWQQFKAYSEKYLKSNRIIALPLSKVDERLTYLWEPFSFTGHPTIFFGYTNIVESLAISPDEQIVLPTYFNHVGRNEVLASSIDHILIQNDVYLDEKNKNLINSIMPIVNSSKKRTFGKLDLYPIKKELTTNKIRSSKKVIYDKTCKNISPSAISLTKKSNSHDNFIITDLKVEEINPTKYKVTILSQKNNNLALFFAETYNTGWNIYLSDGYFSKPIISQSNHQIANCLFNFWNVPYQKLNGSKTFYIIYTPQIIFNYLKLGWLTSISLSLVLFFIFLKAGKLVKKISFNQNFFFYNLRNSILLKKFISHLIELRLVYLTLAIYLFFFDLQTFYNYSDQKYLLLLLFWLLAVFTFRINSTLTYATSMVYLILTIIARLCNLPLLSEAFAARFYIFAVTYVIHLTWQCYFNRKIDPIQKLYSQSLNDITLIFGKLNKTRFGSYFNYIYLWFLFFHDILIQIYGKAPKTHQQKRILLKKLLITLLLAILLYQINWYKGHLKTRELINPDIKIAEPGIIYPGMKVVIYGHNFGWKSQDKKNKLMSQYGEVNTDLWTDSQIIFTIPFQWKIGVLSFWIEKPVQWDGKNIQAKSKIIKIEIIPISDTMTKKDDLYFQQLKKLNPETLKINGY